MIPNRKPQNGLVKVEIDFIGGSRALRYTRRLSKLLMQGKKVLRGMGNRQDADLLTEWQLTTRYRITNQHHWIMELTGQEWLALSRALRHQGTSGVSLLSWLSRHKLNYYE